jgi:hypothetical protein
MAFRSSLIIRLGTLWYRGKENYFLIFYYSHWEEKATGMLAGVQGIGVRVQRGWRWSNGEEGERRSSWPMSY